MATQARLQTYSVVVSTILTMISSILPGARSIRNPVASGLLWTVFLWLVFGDRIPENGDSGRAGQIYDFADYLGRTWFVLLGAFLVFVLGALGGYAVDAIGRRVAAAEGAVARAVRWQIHAQRSFRTLKRQLRQYQRDEALHNGSPRIGEKTDEDERFFESRLDTLHSNLGTVELKLDRVRRWGRYRLMPLGWIRDNQMTRFVLGERKSADEWSTANRIVDQRYRSTFIAAIKESGIDFDQDLGRFSASTERADDLIAEFKPDPLDALKSLDNDLYIEIDRERSERELRVAIAGPLVAIFVALALQESWWFVGGAVLAVLLLVSNSVTSSEERARIMNLVNLRDKVTPAMRDAEVEARVEAINYVTKVRRAQSRPAAKSPS